MPKELLAGSLDEQCAFLYALALEKMEQGNFTGAMHALKEVVRHQPDFQEAVALLHEAKRRKSEQQFLLTFSFVGAILFVGVGTLVRFSNDIWLLMLALVGLLLGYGLANFVNSYRR